MDIFTEAIGNACKLNFWKWDFSNNKFEDYGYFGSFSAPDNSFECFLQKIHSSERESVKTIFYQVSKSNELFEKALRIEINDKSLKWVFIRGKAFTENGIIKVGGIIIGINAWRMNEENNYLNKLELMRLMKINANNEMISVLAHELSQPLMVAKTYTSGCLHRLSSNNIDNAQLYSMMQKINKHISIVGDKIHKMKSFMDNNELEYGIANIHDIIQQSLALLSYELQANDIQTNYDFEDNLPLIKMDIMQIKQVVFLLLKNCIDAISKKPNQKTSTVAIKTTKLNDRIIKISIRNYVSGILKNVHKNLFNISFKTVCQDFKTDLEICKTVIEAHGGTLTAKSSAYNRNFNFTLHN